MNNAANIPENKLDGRRAIFRFAFGAWGRSLCFLAAFAICIGYVSARWRQTECRPLMPVQLDAEWIATRGQFGFLGLFPQVDPIRRAGQTCLARRLRPGTLLKSRSTANRLGSLDCSGGTRAPFQTSLTEANQSASSPRPALGSEFPPRISMGRSRQCTPAVWLDIAGQPSSRAQCRSASSSRPAIIGRRLQAQGAIELWSGEIIPIRTDGAWKCGAGTARPLALGVDRPELRRFPLAESGRRPLPVNEQLVAFDRRIFQRPFEGRWIAVPRTALRIFQARMNTVWELPARPREAYLRVLANRVFQVIVNGQPLRPTMSTHENQDSGQWIVNSIDRPDDVFRKPELVNPDQIGSPFANAGPQPASPTRSRSDAEA